MASVKELSDTAVKHDLGIGEIFAIGNVTTAFDTSQDLLRVFARGGAISIRSTVPEKYKVKKSPSWILYTREGEILLEATGPLANNFNQKGEFIDKNAHLEKIVSANTGKKTSADKEGSAPIATTVIPVPASPTATPAPIEIEEIR